MFLCFLDIKKAFDRVNFSKLFKKLLARSVPVYIVKFIAHWYTSQKIMIRWGNSLSDPFTVSNGIKQGGLLSPYLFNLYMDNLSYKLNDCGVGCVVNLVLVNHLAYADDMILIAPSRRALQVLLNTCSVYAAHHDIIYSTEKSFCMICWPKRFLYKFIPDFFLQNDKLDFVNEYKYLGVLFNDKINDDAEICKRMRNIYATGNMVCRKFANCTNNCKILMFKTFFSQIYCCSLWASYKLASYSKAKIAHNDIFRSLLQVPRYESASALFANNRVSNLDAVVRSSYYSLMCRVKSSANIIVAALCNSEARLHSRLWERWSAALGRDLVETF